MEGDADFGKTVLPVAFFGETVRLLVRFFLGGGFGDFVACFLFLGDFLGTAKCWASLENRSSPSSSKVIFPWINKY